MLARLLHALSRSVLLLGSAVVPALARADTVEDPFAMVELKSNGRTVAAELGDFDGDGRTDLLQIVFIGIPPDDQRLVRLWRQTEHGELEPKPKYEIALPEGSAAYDIGDVLPDLPGDELVLLRPQGLTILSFANPALPEREIRVDGGTMAAAEDERGLDRLKLVFPEFGPEPWLLAPMLAQTAFYAASGERKALLEVGARANYFLPQRPGPLFVDSDIQLLLDMPRISVGDVDGDGRTDVVASGRHDLRVFLRRPDGSFPRAADRVLKLALVTEEDHIRGSGAVRCEARDVSGDGKLDLLISHLAGGVTDARSDTSIYLNHGGTWNLAKPDFALPASPGWAADQLIDIDHDGRPELMHVSVPFGVLALIQALVTRSVDADVAVYRSDENGKFAPEPWFRRRLSVAFSFDTARPLGFVPTGNFDLNGDGFDDLLTAGKGDRIDVWLGGPTGMAQTVSGRQKLHSSGRLRGGDWDGDGLADFVLYDPRDPNAPVEIARNRGLLPGTLPRIGAATPWRAPPQ
ncbi:MAG TPA: VCBS repeat-containing protein [Myxococcota bacterium]|nr:VCBS repeat-containing protein [Myxococcota bacterium]